MGMIAVLTLMLVSMKRRLPTRRLSSGITTLALAGIVLLVAAGGASADEEITSLPFTTNEDGERYYLEGDLICADTSTAGITIANNNVIIDGQGNKITGSASAGACADAMQTSPATHSGIRKSADVKNTMIKDLEIVEFCTGVGIEGAYTYTGDDYNTEVTGCVIHDNGNANSITHGVHLTGANKCTITKNEIYNQDGTADMGACGAGGNGISMHGVVDAGGDYNTITCNHLHDNAKCGFHMKFKCMYNTISHNNVTGNAGAGIMPECKKSDWNTIEYNYIKDNGPYYGFYTRGSNNVIRYNTIINTKGANGHYYGIYIGTAGMPSPNGRFNDIANNSVCGSQAEDILIDGPAAGTNTIDDNTCDLSSGGSGNGCPWNCDDPVSVYYDYDGDGFYSNDPENCVCANAMNTGSCCNPGLFNQTHASMLNASSICWLTAGTDPCDCDPAYILNWMTYPYRTWEQTNWSGPAVMQMMVDHYRPEEPAQSYLNATGIAHNHNCNSGLPYVDRYGMQWTLNNILHNTSSYGGGRFANYGNHITTDVENALHYICWWQSAGPGAVPAYTNYSNWMVVRGIHTDINPRDGSYYPPYGYTIYGFWINDPNPSGIGENSYKCVNQFTENYYQAMQGQCDVADGSWVSSCEPPEVDAEITLADSPARLAKAITPVLAEKRLMVYDVEQLALEKVVQDDDLLKIVAAAIDGVNEQLVPYDAEFAEVFAETVAGEPMFVSSDNGDYYLVPFNVPVEVKSIKKVPVAIEKVKISGDRKLERVKRVADEIEIEPIPIEPIKLERTLVVVLVDAEDGSFNEASWVSDPVDYLPVSTVEALKLALGEIDITAMEDLSSLISEPTIELVHRDASPYHPDWKITIGDKIFYVSQDGTVS